jgi:hypothetical protein
MSIGRSDIGVLFVSMSAKDPDGRDPEYLAWHALDHRPEQYRVPGLRASLRLVSTPACRAARAASSERYDAVDHVMTYFFSDIDALAPFGRLGSVLGKAGRMTHMLPAVERAVYRTGGASAAPRIKAGADVLPWWPATGVYLLVEQGSAGVAHLLEIDGVAGVWWAAGVEGGEGRATDDVGALQITYCFLDGDPVDTAERVRPALERRRDDLSVTPLLAAPFHIPVNHEWDRYVP